MIKLYPKTGLGGADHGWLKTKHHFSFADYNNPDRVHFGALRVINDDQIEAGSGFDPHSHKNMEIITYVRSGAVLHRDSLGNEGRTSAGDLQVMSAGTGISHAEYADPHDETTLYQIWIFPNAKNVTPRWDQRAFPKDPVHDSLTLLVSGDLGDVERGALFIYQDAQIYGGKLSPFQTITHPLNHQAYILGVDGQVQVAGHALSQGDGIEVTDQKDITITAGQNGGSVLVIDVPRDF